MKKLKLANKPVRSRQVICIMATLLATSAISSVTATFAWFEYATRAGLNFEGTAVGVADSLLIGIESPELLPEYDIYGLIQDEENPHIYWSPAELSAETLAYYSQVNGFASNRLHATTSGKFKANDEFSLSPAPTYRLNYNSEMKAEKENYLYLPLVFKPTGNSLLSKGNIAVTLTDCKIKGSGLITNSARLAFVSPQSNTSFIFNPNVEKSGQDVVGGILDLNGDGFYDYNVKGSEIVYGEVKNRIIYSKFPSVNKDPMDEENRSTFNSAHAFGAFVVDEKETIYETADYLGRRDTILNKTLAKTLNKENTVKLDTYIYCEGWAKTTIDINAFNYFSLDLSFELQEA